MNIDDLPVGQHKGMDIPEFLPGEGPTADQPPVSNLDIPLNDRLICKNAKQRLEAFTELMKLFTDKNFPDPELDPYIANFPKYLADSHPGAQEKALDTLLLFLTKCPPQTNLEFNELVSVLIEKGFISSKSSVKTKSTNALLALAQMDSSQSIIHEAIISRISSKNPKICSAAIQSLTTLLANFGNSVYPIPAGIQAIALQAATSSNKDVRNDSMNYFKEAYRWIREGIFPALSGLKQAQQDELKMACSSITESPVSAKLQVKGKIAEIASSPIQNNDMPKSKPVEKKPEPPAAAPDFSKFGEAWCENLLTTKKWSDKRDLLEDLLKFINSENVKPDNFGELGNMLKKILSDSNIVVVNLALKCIGNLSNVLKSGYAPFAKSSIHAIIQKFKDKKTQNEAQKCIESIINCFNNIDDILDDIKEGLNDKSPLVKLYICGWIEKAVLPKLNVGLASSILSILIKLTDDASNEVRDATLSLLGAMKVQFGDCDVVNKPISDMIPQKQEKIAEAVSRITGKKDTSGIIPEPMKTDIPNHTSAQPPKTQKKCGSPQINSSNHGQKMAMQKEDENNEISEEEAIQILSEKMPGEIISGLSKPEWKERVQTLQNMHQFIQENSDKVDSKFTDALSRFIRIKLKDFKESNINILKEAISLLNLVAETCAVSKKFANCVITGLSEKLADPKQTEPIVNLFLTISDTVTPTFVATIIMKSTIGGKNPNLPKAGLIFLKKLLEEYTPLLLPLKQIVEFCKTSIGNSNPQVRNAATSLMCTIYGSIGDTVKSMLLSDLKDTTVKSIECELSKTSIKEKTLSEVKRKLRGDTEKEFNSKKAAKVNAADALVPRMNIAPLITSKILSGLTNSGMKQRQEAKDSLDHILQSANNRIKPDGLGPLFTALKSRMNEPCKNLAKSFITLIGTLSIALGNSIRQYIKVIIQPLMFNLADKQTSIRQETINALDKIAENAGLDTIFNNAGQLLEKDNPELRTELLGYILKHKDGLQKSDSVSLIKGLVACIQDRSKEIRNLAEEVIGQVVPITGHLMFIDAIRDLKPAVKETLKSIIDKYKVMVPFSAPSENAEPMEITSDPREETKINIPKTQPVLQQPKTEEIKLPPKIIEKPQSIPMVIQNPIQTNPIQNISPDLQDLMNSPLSNRTLEALRILTEKLKTNPETVLAACTPLFNWISLKLATNLTNQLNKPAGEFLFLLFTAFSQSKISLSDLDASIVLPSICDKLSSSYEIFGVLCNVYAPAKVIFYLSKPLEYAGAKIQTDCLKNIQNIIKTRGISAISEVSAANLAPLLNSGDQIVKENLISVLKEYYKLQGEEIWKTLTDIIDPHKEMLKKEFCGNSVQNTENESPGTQSVRKSLKKFSISEEQPAAKNQATPLKNVTNQPPEIIAKRSVSPIPKSLQKVESLEQCLYQLKYGEITHKIDSLMFLGEKATECVEGKSNFAQMHCNNIIMTFAEVMKDLFNSGFDEVQLRFIKYFMNMTNKICSAKAIVYDMGELELKCIMEQLLTKLLFDGLEKLGTNNEGETLMKCLNSTILRLLENCQPTKVFCVLIDLLKAYIGPQNGNASLVKLPGLIVKCLLKLTKVMEHLISNIDLSKLFLSIHEFLIANPSNPNPATTNEEIGSRIIKTIVNEVVKLKKEEIWESYKLVQDHPKPDLHIKRWITVIIRSLRTSSSAQRSLPAPAILSETKKNSLLSGTPASIQKSTEKTTDILAIYRSRLAALQGGRSLENRENTAASLNAIPIQTQTPVALPTQTPIPTPANDIFARIDQFKALMNKTMKK